MCTVVIETDPSATRLLAVRDEDPQREWDDLGAWWPVEHPGVIGIRDRRAGGAWLAYHPTTRRLAVLLNRADVADLPADRLRSRGELVLESVAGRSPQGRPLTHGFNLLEVTAHGARVITWDGASLREAPVADGVHMIAHDDLDDPRTARITAWLPRFESTAPDAWPALLAESSALDPEDDRAIIRDNRPHGYPTQSLLYCTADITPDGVSVTSHTLSYPGHFD